MNEKIYLIEEMDYLEHSNCYLIVGSKKCLLIDTGVGLIDFNEIKNRFVKDKELVVVITHFHFDHFAGSDQFDMALANKNNLKNKDVGLKYFKKKDFKNNAFEKISHKEFNINENKFKQIKNESIINLGDFNFEIIFTPGHDESSISLFENEKKILFSGDTIYDGKMYLDFEDSNNKEYISSLKKILYKKPTIILGGHNAPITKNISEFITSKIDLAKEN
ncbi:MBL fold metallo-hydrolase [archaeon]|nr:MBL fold metallo-hydrolase [archaeon]MBL7057181.1 MBL fold metallo-hydrolase [Candidatus Woesearchaeota archaeon]